MNESRRSASATSQPIIMPEGWKRKKRKNKELRLDPCQSSVKDKNNYATRNTTASLPRPQPLSAGRGITLPLKSDRCTKWTLGRLLFARRFSAVQTGDSIRQSKKYQIVVIKDTGKEETNAGFACCSSAATDAAASDANRWRNAQDVTKEIRNYPMLRLFI